MDPISGRPRVTVERVGLPLDLPRRSDPITPVKASPGPVRSHQYEPHSPVSTFNLLPMPSITFSFYIHTHPQTHKKPVFADQSSRWRGVAHRTSNQSCLGMVSTEPATSFP